MQREDQDTEVATEIRRDGEDLRRSMRITLLSYLLKFSQPVLLVIVIRLYGAAEYGEFVVVKAMLMVMMRICLVGFDRGVLWWVSRQPRETEREGLLPALWIAASTSATLALVTWAALAPTIAAWADRPEAADSLRWMVVGLVPLTVMEVVASAAVAKRRISAHVIFKEGLVGQALVGFAILFYLLGLSAIGLALSFTLSALLGLLGVVWVFRQAFAGSRWQGQRLPPQMLRFSLNNWIADILGIGFGNLDVFMLAAFTNPLTVGVYQGAVQVAQQVSAVRWSFQPLVTAVVAEIGLRNQIARIRQGFSHAMILVLTIQIPVVALTFAFAAWILPLLGERFVAGLSPALVLTAVFLVYGSVGMANVIVQGYGRAGLIVVNMGLALGVGALAHSQLIPRLGGMGAALSVAISYLVLTAVQLIEARVIVGAWFFSRDLVRLVGSALAAAAVMAGVWSALAAIVGWPTGKMNLVDGVVRGGSLAAFIAVFGLGWLRLRRAGRRGSAT